MIIIITIIIVSAVVVAPLRGLLVVGRRGRARAHPDASCVCRRRR
jgi:hypothetical protein